MRCLKLLAITFLFPVILFSQTFIPAGNVSGVWNPDGNPYYILGDIAINEVDSLYINPGVEIVFTDNYWFNIFGYLIAIGTASDSIIFTVADTSGFSTNSHLGWSGVWIPYSTAHLKYCIVEYSKASGISNYGCEIIIENCTSRFNSGDGLVISDGTNGIINEVNFSDNLADGLSISWCGDVEINNYEINNNGGYGLTIDDTYYLFESSNGIIKNNYSGGVRVYYESGAHFNNLLIEGNGNVSSLGGGILTTGGCYFDNVVIRNNTALKGGGVYCSPEGFETMHISNSTIEGNTAMEDGGGIFWSQFFIDVLNTRISGNSAHNGAGIYITTIEGGSFSNCEIANNNATLSGGGIFCNHIFTSSSIIFDHLTISDNTANISGGGLIYAEYDGQPIVFNNSIFWNNNPDEILDAFGKVNITYSDVNGGWPGTGNIQEDPLFVDPINGDYQLSWDSFPLYDNSKSPCIDSGNPTSPFDPDGTITDMGAYSFDQLEAAQYLPVIISILDVPNDQGQEVVINWTRSILDNSSGGSVIKYSIWRAQDWAETPWEYMGSIPAQDFEEYAFIAPTISDSVAGEIPYYTFLVSAETDNPDVYYRSVPDSGYSVDNLAPNFPLGFLGLFLNEQVELNWNSSLVADFDYFAIYKSDDPENFLTTPYFTTTDTVFIDIDFPADTLYYKATTFDINGNESAFSEIVEVIIDISRAVEITVRLEGPFYGISMIPYLNNSGLLPLNQPFNSLPWNYNGLESVSEIPNPRIIDWVLLELRDAPTAQSATESTIIHQQAVFLLNNGSIVSLDGITSPRILFEIENNLYLSIKHRNHLSLLSAFPLIENGGKYIYDFSSAASQALGGSLVQKELSLGIWGTRSGDANNDGQIDNIDKNENWAEHINESGYLTSDLNMNGIVDLDDKNECWLPNAGYSCQIPE